MLSTIITYLCIILAILQIFVLLQIIYSTYKDRKESKLFYEKIHKELDESNKMCLDKLNELNAKENNKNEQNK